MTADLRLVDTSTGEIVAKTSLTPVPTFSGAWLTSLDEARRTLALVETVDEAAELVNAAETAKVYARNVLRSREAQNHAAHVSLLCQRKAGALLAATDLAGNRHTGSTLEPLGVDKKDSHRWQRVAAIPERTFTAHVEKVVKDGHELTTAGVLRAVGSVIQSSETNEWYTPPQYLDAARHVLGAIDLDPASCAEANKVVNADSFYGAEVDGLTMIWFGRVWLNPPYGRLAGDFIARLVEAFEVGEIDAGICLVNAHCTDTKWFQPLWDHTLCFTDHRIDFAAGTDGRGGSTHGSVFAYLGPDPALFNHWFQGFGAVVQRMSETPR